MRRPTVLLAVILLVAALLRFWRLGAGIPFSVGVDEPEIVTRVMQMMRSGDFAPRFYDYPTLYIYIQLIIAVFWFLIGALAGKWHSLQDVSAWDFLVWGRAITAVLGTLTVMLVHQIGMRWGARYALLAAGLMAVMPLHVRESHYVLTDVPLTFFVTLTFLLTLRANEHQRATAFAAAGAAAGFAAATKYPGALALALPLAGVLMTPGLRPSRVAGALLTVGACALAFFLAAPYTIMDLPGFLNGFGKLSASYSTLTPPEAPWITYVKHLRIALQWPAFLLAIAGIVLATVRAAKGPGRLRWMLAVLFPLLFLWFLSGQTLVFARYLLPMVPFVCVLVAAAVVSGVSLLRRFSIPRAFRTALIAGLTAAAVVPPAITAIAFNRGLGHLGTKAEAYHWIQAGVPKEAKIVTEAHGLILPEHTSAQHTRRLTMRSYEDYVAQGVEYLIASSQNYGPFFSEPHRYPAEYAAYRRLFDQTREVARFSPADPLRAPEIRILKVVP